MVGVQMSLTMDKQVEINKYVILQLQFLIII